MMRSTPFPPRRPSHLVRYIVPSIIVICFLYYMSSTSPTAPVSYVTGSASSGSGSSYPETDHGPAHNVPPKGAAVEHNPAYEHHNEETDQRPNYGAGSDPLPKPPVHATPDSSSANSHPIDVLIKSAAHDFDALMAKEASSLKEAASLYRMRRGRHPPPGFKAWYEFAKAKNAVMVEDFFDQIYHDLGPFWGVDPKLIRKEAWDWEMTINIRSGVATAGSDWFWTQIWLKMIKTVEHLLPDMDIALNAMDEPRLVVPWEVIDKAMQKEKKTRVLTPTKDVLDVMVELPPPDKMDKKPDTQDKKWEGAGPKPYWDIARRGCPPDSPARKKPLVGTFDKTPAFETTWATPHMLSGYVSNYTLSTEFCHQPDLQGLEGIFIHPLSTSATKTLFPMFGGSKLATNNEILLPAPMYWNEEERFTGGDDHGPEWSEKKCDVIWRGVATGGKNTADTWKGFQRHRFVSMNNGTSLTRATEGTEKPVNYALPASTYDLMAVKEKRLGEWVGQFADVGLTDLMCDDTPHEGIHCPYTDPYFTITPGQPMRDQFACKFLPDIDGNSFSGRYLGFLRSTSLPIKSTMWREWHDSRLVAWKHFVPMDNRFGDYYGIMEYFLGYGKTVPDHDEVARKIAMDGKEWAEKVLRKEDMQIYVLRLLLEYARISDPRRERMGWVDDL